MKYRAEIDGLRALAVIPVVLFHAGFQLFSGGYVGVDVFFVISGYLITSIIIEDIQKNRFSISEFYQRRARRILPALFVVLILCVPFAWFLMLPNQADEFANSLLAVSFFVSNIFFWFETGYFSTAAEEKPLLHTWSLAVEEQYYLFFPFFLIVLWRFGRNKVFWSIFVCLVLSLFLSEWGSRNKPSANFYLAPTRVWELLVGSIAAFLVNDKGVYPNKFLSAFGLLAVVFSIFTYDKSIPFPSFYTLVPVIGVVFIILFSGNRTWVAEVLSNKILVGVGLISYSAYLFHQPIFAFTRIALIEEPSLALMGAMTALTFLLAYLSWRYIETPFRKLKTTPFKVLSASILGLLFFSLIGLVFEGRQDYTESELELLAWSDYTKTNQFKASWELDECYIENRSSQWIAYNHDKCLDLADDGMNLVVLGDSHAAQLVAPLRRLPGLNLTNLTSSGCRPFISVSPSDNSECLKRNRFFFEDVLVNRKDDIDVIILAARWQNNELNELKQVLNYLSKLELPTIVVGGSPWFATEAPIIMLRRPHGKVDKSYISYSLVAQDSQIKAILPEDFDFVSVEDFICSNQCNLVMDGELLLFDNEHLTPNGAALFTTSKLLPVISTKRKGDA